MQAGYQLRQATPACTSCGQSLHDDLGGRSGFMRVRCLNPECTMLEAKMVVERETMLVLFTDFRMIDGKPAWPSHWQDRNGFQVLPKAGKVTGG